MAKAKLKVANFTAQELERLINLVQQSNWADSDKNALLAIVELVEQLIEKLRAAKIDIHKLKQMMGFHSELLKKLQQTQG